LLNNTLVIGSRYSVVKSVRLVENGKHVNKSFKRTLQKTNETPKRKSGKNNMPNNAVDISIPTSGRRRRKIIRSKITKVDKRSGENDRVLPVKRPNLPPVKKQVETKSNSFPAVKKVADCKTLKTGQEKRRKCSNNSEKSGISLLEQLNLTLNETLHVMTSLTVPHPNTQHAHTRLTVDPKCTKKEKPKESIFVSKIERDVRKRCSAMTNSPKLNENVSEAVNTWSSWMDTEITQKLLERPSMY